MGVGVRGLLFRGFGFGVLSSMNKNGLQTPGLLEK